MDAMIYFRIPSEWLQVLDNVQKRAPKAFIAGGCLRDYFNERPVNDLDIFVPKSRGGIRQQVALTHPVRGKSIDEPYLTHDVHVQYIDYYEDPTGKLPAVNLIGVSDYICTPWDQLDRFDFGVCQVAYDGQQLFMSTGYGRDVKQNTFTLRDGQTQMQRDYSLGRWDRISKKYPGWKLVDTAKRRLFDCDLDTI